ncbi:MAG: WecB/TagA/CpsF family glycosyltransferase [Pseudanabaenaceae cyanobacterium bins.68]|nr:WecB/TagA/CpsF family glycosyltransferase [Pseudanabaenaceae cyanobacterium bins.68]
MSAPIRIIDTPIAPTSYAQAWLDLENWIAQSSWGFVVAANVHVVVTAHRSPSYGNALTAAHLITPDGMPLVWVMRLLGAKGQTRVYGPDLMLYCCDRAQIQGYKIYLYGSSAVVLAQLHQNLSSRYPQLQICGSYAPGILSTMPSWAEIEADIYRINQSGAQIVMVGLGCPKQEYWMAAAKPSLKAIAIGVGAAFDFHGGKVKQAPRWLMAIGLEWLYRWLQEPRRLASRYLVTNPLFILLLGRQLWRQYVSHH